MSAFLKDTGCAKSMGLMDGIAIKHSALVVEVLPPNSPAPPPQGEGLTLPVERAAPPVASPPTPWVCGGPVWSP